jgi:hypothetical protein
VGGGDGWSEGVNDASRYHLDNSINLILKQDTWAKQVKNINI